VVRIALVALVAAAGCTGGLDCAIGNPSAAPELTLVTRTVEGRLAPLAAGGEIHLIKPPQGGEVVLVGARARNVACVVQVFASLRDEASGRIAGSEGRPVKLTPTADGWGEPEHPAEFSNYANVPACPSGNMALRKNLHGEPYLVRLRLEDRGRSAEATARVTPICAEPGLADKCRCECGANYVLGQSCAPDGGTP
jgi:hypothetical protein